MKNITYAADVPAGYEMIEDTPLHRCRKTWPARRQERTLRPVKGDANAKNQTRREE